MRTPPEGSSVQTPTEPTPTERSLGSRPTAVAIAGCSDVGLTRDRNEDAFLVWDLAQDREVESAVELPCDGSDTALLLAVSDGMGGSHAGEVASRTALHSLVEFARRNVPTSGVDEDEVEDGLERWLELAAQRSNDRVFALAREDPSKRGMGATLSGVIILEHRLGVTHVGDSRVYLLRRERLRQLTVDHTRVQDLVALGHLSVEQAREHRERNLLIQAIGVAESIEVDAFDLQADSGDRLLICSDGLHGLVEDVAISEVLGSNATPFRQCLELIERANAVGGYDNITVVVAHFI